MKEMFEASVDGEAFDMERWSQYFKPAGYGGSGQATGSAPRATPAATPAPEADEDTPAPVATKAPVKEDAPAGADAGGRAADILAMIRNRQKT